LFIIFDLLTSYQKKYSKNAVGEILIYRKNFVLRIIQYFLYYWMMLTALLFLTVITAWLLPALRDMVYPGEITPTPTGNERERWGMLLFAGAVVVLLAWFIWNSAMKMRKPRKVFEGIITEKKKRLYDDGWCYFVHLSPGEDKQVEVNEKSFEKLSKGNKVRITFSAPLGEPLKITRLYLK
jgi:hypothetical protein